MRLFLMILTIGSLFLPGCRSSVKQQQESVYSRHLQRHVDLTVITTPMPDKKEEMNLLLFINKELIEETRAKKIIDSLYKKKLIQPVTLVAFSGKNEDYGLEETPTTDAKEYRQFNDFVMGELYPFIKKKVVIRKFNSVAICGFGNSALSAFDIAWNNDDKIQRAGMFYPVFDDNSTLETVQSLRKRPDLGIWMAADENDSSSAKFKDIISSKRNISECKLVTGTVENSNRKLMPPVTNFADFLLWAFSRN